MKKLILPLFVAFAAVIFLNSCSVEKRLYRPGINVEWRTSIKKSKLNNEEITETKVENSQQSIKLLKTNNELSFSDEQSKNKVVLNNNEISTHQDKLVENSNSHQQIKIDNNNQLNTKRKFKTKQIKEFSQSTKSNTTIKAFKSQREKFSNSNKSLDSDVIIGVVLCIFGLAPFGILVAKGKRSGAFKTNLLIWIGGWASYILGLVLVLSGSFFGLIFTALAFILLLISLIHGIINVLK
jgi:cation transport ATPase